MGLHASSKRDSAAGGRYDRALEWAIEAADINLISALVSRAAAVPRAARRGRSYDGWVPADLAASDTAASARPIGRQLARQWAGPVLAPSPAAMRRLALAGVVTSAGIIITGAAVRLSQSGLGCPTWPSCTATSIVAGGTTGDPLIHRWIEFGNRLVTVAIFAVAALVFVAALRFRPGPGAARRRDLIWLASAQPAGIVVQAGLGGIVVLTKLNPGWVSVHFMASMALVAATVALSVRCTEAAVPARPLVRPELRILAYGVLAVVTAMIAAGTVVTGTGPLAGAASVARYRLPLGAVTQLHADIGWLVGGLVIALALGLRLTAAPGRAVRLGWILVGLVGLQGVIGYAQYFSGLPAGLVWVHVIGSVLIWITVLRLMFALRDRGAITGPVVASAGRSGGEPG